MTRTSILVLCCSWASAAGFYLPGVAPHEYAEGERVELKVNKLTSTKTQLPYEYYSLPFCPPDTMDTVAENLGEVLRGDKIMHSNYELKMGVEESCKVLCRKELTADDAKLFSTSHRRGLPRHGHDRRQPARGDARGRARDAEHAAARDHDLRARLPARLQGLRRDPRHRAGANYLYNHLRFVFKYHMEQHFDGSRIVGFEVEPFSVKHKYDGGAFEASRAAHDLHQGEARLARLAAAAGQRGRRGHLHVRRAMGVLGRQVGVAVGRVPVRDGRADPLVLDRQLPHDRPLPLGHGRHDHDAHAPPRPQPVQRRRGARGGDRGERVEARPRRRLPRAAAVRPARGLRGDGRAGPLHGRLHHVFAVLGFLSPANRGGLMSALLLLFVLMGVVAGYVSAVLYKSFKGDEWKLTTLKTALMFPGIVASVFFVLNLFIWGEKSSGAVPFTTLLALLAMWFGISVPLVFLGAYFGYSREAVSYPTKTNLIPRSIPERPWYMTPLFSILVGGVLPFGAVFIELFFILSSIWLHQYYYVFGFLLVVLLILLVTCAEITIVMCYFQLCAEDYHWWWRAFLTAGCSGLYLFAYSIVYMATKMNMARGVSVLLYVGYMAIASYSFFTLTGTVGFLACWYFVRIIYAAVKVE